MTAYTNAVTVSLSNTVPLAKASQALYIGVTGNVTVSMIGGANVQFVAVPAGTFLNVRALYVKTDTTATSILALN